MPAITKSGNVLTKKPTKIEESNSVSFEYVINETTLLNKLKTVDGEGSGLDADLVRGDYINPRMFKNRIINGDFSIWQRGEDFLFGTPDSWAASTSYSVGDIIIPTTANGFYYECTVAGTSGSSEPTWPTNVGDTVTDNEVTWVCKGVQYSENHWGYTADRYRLLNEKAGGIFKVIRSNINDISSFKVVTIIPPTNLTWDGSTPRAWKPFTYYFEGQQFYDLALNKKIITVSFLFKSNVAGKFAINLRNHSSAFNAHLYDGYYDTYVTTFEYPGDESVQKITKTIPLNCDWTWGIRDNNIAGFCLYIATIGDGCTTNVLDQWTSGYSANSAGANWCPHCPEDYTNWAAQAGNYIEIAELQLEEGEVATEFEHVPYDIQLMRCMRYYWRLENKDNTGIEITNGYWKDGYYAYGVLRFPVKMRTKPTLKCSDIQNIRVLKGGGPSTGNTESLSAVMNEDACRLTLKKDTDNNMGGEGTIFYISADTPGWIAFDAEL